MSSAPRADRFFFTVSAAVRSLYMMASVRLRLVWNSSQHAWYSDSEMAQSKLYPPNSSQCDPMTRSEDYG